MIEPKEFINYKNKDYFFITKENIDGKEIYHYLCEDMIDYIIDDDKYESIDINNPPIFSMFISYENNKYSIVENKRLIKKYIKEFGMEPEYIAYDAILTMDLLFLAAGMGIYLNIIKPYKLDNKTKEEFKEQQKRSFKELKEKLNLDIDLDEIDKKIDKVQLMGMGNEKTNMMGMYHFLFNKVFIKKSIINDKSRYPKVGLHETTHYLGGRDILLKNYFSRAIMEGATENLVVDFYDEGKSKGRYLDFRNNDKYKKAYIQENYNTISGYSPYINLVKQLEYITGEKSYKSIINGDRNFIKNVEKEIGRKDLLKIIGKSSLLYYLNHPLRKLGLVDKSFDLEKSINDQILESYFGRKYNEIQSPEEAKAFMEKLRGFETCRPKISYLTNDNEVIKDDTFKKFYEEKYNGVVEKFQFDENTKEEYKYKEQPFRELKLERDEDIKKAILVHTNDIKNPMKVEMDKIITKNGGAIYFSKSGIYRTLSFPGEEALIYESLRNKYPDKEYEEIIEMFIDKVEHKEKREQIEITEEDIKKAEEYKNAIKDNNSLALTGKKPSIIDRIKNAFKNNRVENNVNDKKLIDKQNKGVKENRINNKKGISSSISKWSFDSLDKEEQKKLLLRQANKIREFHTRINSNGTQDNTKKHNKDDINKLGLE